MSKKSVIAVVVASLVSLGGAGALLGAPAPKAPAAGSTVPVKSVHHKKKTHHPAHASKHQAAPASKTTAK
ncbi:MAG TPA: hypothetical protein PLB01_02335 [Thermoanaerobaculia bacterium]|nr:hypothetical protein [Thermoanaerobaculia bacterium]